MALMIGLRVRIEILLNQRVVVRVEPEDPGLLTGYADPAS
jgi:hypothetical protein